MKAKLLVMVFMLCMMNLPKSEAQFNVSDSLVLVEFYWATNGPNWINNTNWLITPVVNWYGITSFNTENVTAINLPSNNLTGYLTPLLCQLPELIGLVVPNNFLSGQIPVCFGVSLHDLNLSNNSFSGDIPESLGWSAHSGNLYSFFISHNLFEGVFPDTIISGQHLLSIFIDGNDFTSITKRTPNTIAAGFKVEDNKLTFKDIVPYTLDPASPWWVFTYAPQDSILDPIDTTVLLGSTLILDSWIDTCSNNKYRWKKNGNWLSPFQSFDPELVINNIQYSDSGTYTCDVTNFYAYDLTLHRRLIKVHVTTDVGDLEPRPREELQVSHDPKEDMLHILMDFNTSESITCNLYDVNGRKMMRCYEGITKQQDFHYSLHSFPHGVYFLRTTAGQKSYVHKIVK